LLKGIIPRMKYTKRESGEYPNELKMEIAMKRNEISE